MNLLNIAFMKNNSVKLKIKRMYEMNINQQFSATHSHKEIAITFLKLVATGSVRDAFQQYIGANFIHHNPYFAGDGEALMLAMEENASINPDKIFEVKLAIQEDNMVTVYSHVKQHKDDLGGAVVHIFRFQENKIVELWDIGQPVPEDSPNENGMF